jgi:hypothetical protein
MLRAAVRSSEMKSLLERKVRLALRSAILTLLVVGAISYRSTVVFIEKKFSRTSKVYSSPWSVSDRATADLY